MIDDIESWEDCGLTCKDDAECKSWAWNVPHNNCFKKCKRCLHYTNSITITETTPNRDWISGLKNCYASLIAFNVCQGIYREIKKF